MLIWILLWFVPAIIFVSIKIHAELKRGYDLLFSDLFYIILWCIAGPFAVIYFGYDLFDIKTRWQKLKLTVIIKGVPQ